MEFAFKTIHEFLMTFFGMKKLVMNFLRKYAGMVFQFVFRIVVVKSIIKQSHVVSLLIYLLTVVVIVAVDYLYRAH